MTTADTPESRDCPLPPDIALALEEYRTVREEELVALQGQIATLRYGVAGCVVLIGFAAQQHGDRYLGWAVSLALVPLVVLFSAIIWMGEYERGARAGHYIATKLEGRINAMLSGARRPLRWEGWLREGENAPSRLVGGHHRYLAIAGVFIGFQIAAVTMGLHFYWHTHSHDPSRHWLVPVAVIVNLIILLTLLGYFRSCYERLRDYTTEPEERQPTVRQRVRMRLRLYSIFLVVGFISAPFYSWPLGIAIVWGMNSVGWVGHMPSYWIVLPTLVWMAIIPLISSRGLMRELLGRRILHETTIGEGSLEALEERGLLGQLTNWQKERLRMVDSEEMNAPSIGRRKNITVTGATLADQDNFPGVLAHEVGHHRLHHLHPLGLSYLYLWPYFYYDDRVFRRPVKPGRSRRLVRRALFSIAALPGWLAWVVLRLGWRTAEYDADRFACVLGYGELLADALRRHQERWQEKRPEGWQDRVSKGRERLNQGRGLGYLPVPNEHPIPGRRLKQVEEWLWVQDALGGLHVKGHSSPPGEVLPENRSI